MKNSKRPILVWIIFLWFVIGGVAGIYSTYNLSSGNTALPKGYEVPRSFFHYFQAYAFILIYMLSAALLFFRQALSRWLFFGAFVLSTLSSAYSLIFTNIPANQFLATAIFILVTLVIYGACAYYSWSLFEKGYFLNITHNKSSNSDGDKAAASS